MGSSGKTTRVLQELQAFENKVGTLFNNLGKDFVDAKHHAEVVIRLIIAEKIHNELTRKNKPKPTYGTLDMFIDSVKKITASTMAKVKNFGSGGGGQGRRMRRRLLDEGLIHQ